MPRKRRTNEVYKTLKVLTAVADRGNARVEALKDEKGIIYLDETTLADLLRMIENRLMELHPELLTGRPEDGRDLVFRMMYASFVLGLGATQDATGIAEHT